MQWIMRSCALLSDQATSSMVALFGLDKQLSEEQLLLAVAATSIYFDLSIIYPLLDHLQMLHGKFPFWEGVVV